MRKLYSESFNETLVAAIKELQATVDAMPPEAIRSLPVELVDKARLFTSDEFRLDNLATVNSIGGYKFNSMVRHLTSNNFEFYKGTFECKNKSKDAYGGGDDGLITLIVAEEIKLPEGWDGRSGFATIRNINVSAILKDSPTPLNKKVLVTQNQKSLFVEMYVRHTDPDAAKYVFDNDSLGWYYVLVDYILWRRKNV